MDYMTIKRLNENRLRLHMGIPDSAPSNELEHREMAKELFFLRQLEEKVFASHSVLNGPGIDGVPIIAHGKECEVCSALMEYYEVVA